LTALERAITREEHFRFLRGRRTAEAQSRLEGPARS
jgi:hypothetical protein